jgi:polyhydroxyalkanoate synthesis regulator phasin
MRMLVSGFCRLVACCVVVAAVLSPLVLSPTVHAQGGAMRAMSKMNSPNLTSRQMREYADMLGLNADQRQAAEALLEAYEIDYRAATKRVEEVGRAMQDEMFSGELEPTDIGKMYQDMIGKFQRRIRTLETNVMKDLQSLLDDSQAARWPAVERVHRRNTTLDNGSLSGESVDLYSVVSGLELDSASMEPMNGVLEQYGIDLDRRLVERNEVLREQIEGMFNFDTTDPAAMQQRWADMAKKLNDAGKGIVDVNERYARQLEAMIPEATQSAFRDAINIRTFPRVYRPSTAQRMMSAVEAMSDLDESQKQGVAAIKDGYLREAATLNARWAEAIREQEANPDPMAMWGMGGQQGPVKEASNARKELDAKTMESIRTLLTEEQKGRLPDDRVRPELDFDAPPPVLPA